MTTKLYEILAVEKELERAAKKLIASSKKQLGKENLFMGQTKKLEMFNDSDAHLNTIETQKLETTVDENLEYALKSVIKHWDVVVQKDLANQKAIADVVVDGNVILSDVPATTLLGLESKLTELRTLFEAIPTLPPGINWVEDTGAVKGVYRTQEPIIQFKTKNTLDYLTTQPVTKEHPAQVQTFTVTDNVGKFSTIKLNGMVTAFRKAELLKNVDVIQRAIKQARSRANSAIVEHKQIGKDLIDFIMK